MSFLTSLARVLVQVQDVLGLPAAEGAGMTAFVQQFLHDVATTVDPWGYVAEGIQQVGRRPVRGGVQLRRCATVFPVGRLPSM